MFRYFLLILNGHVPALGHGAVSVNTPSDSAGTRDGSSSLSFKIPSGPPTGADFRLRVKNSRRSSQAKSQVKRRLGFGLPVCTQVKRRPSHGAWLLV
jgi:hypothetical protein